jgi:hypothetical protein
MVIQVSTVGPGVEDWRSAKFAATVNGGSPAYVYGYARDAQFSCSVWTALDSIEQSWFGIGADETATIAITLVSAAFITTATVYPKDQGVTQSIAAGVLTLTVPPNVRLRVEVNNDRAEVLSLFSSPIIVEPVAPTDYSTLAVTISSTAAGGEATQWTCGAAHGLTTGQVVIIKSSDTLPSTAAGLLPEFEHFFVFVETSTVFTLGTTDVEEDILLTGTGVGTLTVTPAEWSGGGVLRIPPGVHNLGRDFEVGSNSTVFLDRDAVAVGSFHLKEPNATPYASSTGVLIDGPGVLSGTHTDPLVVYALPGFNEKRFYSAIYSDVETIPMDNTISGITCVAQPYYVSSNGVRQVQNVQAISPWNYSTDGFAVTSQHTDGLIAKVTDCYALVGDDGIKFRADKRSEEHTGTFITVTNNGCFQHWSYPSRVRNGLTCNVLDCHAMNLAGADSLGGGSGSLGSKMIWKALNDGYPGDDLLGNWDINIERLKVWGPLDCRLFVLGNITHPFGSPVERDRYGQLAYVNLLDIWCEEVPGQLSLISSRDYFNTPHDIAIRDMVIGGVAVTESNYSTYFTVDTEVYNLTWEDYVALTVEYSTAGPGVEDWRSTKFAATVNGTAVYVYGHSQATLSSSTAWAYNDVVEQSWFTLGSNETTTVVVSLVSGSVATAVVMSDNESIVSVVSAGVLTLTVPPNVRFRVEINGDRSEAIHISSNPLTVPPPGGTYINYTTLVEPVSAVSLGVDGHLTVPAHGWGIGGSFFRGILVSGNDTLPTTSAGTLSKYEAVVVIVVDADTVQLYDSTVTLINYSDVGSSLTIAPASWANTDVTLLFPPGYHIVSRLFEVSSDTSIYFENGAVVDGSWELSLSSDVTFYGPGMVVAQYATTLEVQALSVAQGFSAARPYALFSGWSAPNSESTDSTISEMTCAILPFYCSDTAFYKWRNVAIISPWTWQSDGIRFSKTTIDGEQPSAADCLIFVGDDAVNLIPRSDTRTISTSLVMTAGNSCFQIGYWPSTDMSLGGSRVRSCAAMNLGQPDSGNINDGNRLGSRAVLKCLVDGDADESELGHFDGVVDGLKILGPLACRAIVLGNVPYPFQQENRRSGYGQLNGWFISNVTMEEVPGQLSLIYSRDNSNTPHDIAIRDMVIGGVAVTESNYSTYFTVSPQVYNLTWEDSVILGNAIANILKGNYPNRFRVGDVLIDTSTRTTLKVVRLVGSSQAEIQNLTYVSYYQSEVIDLSYLIRGVSSGSIKRIS